MAPREIPANPDDDVTAGRGDKTLTFFTESTSEFCLPGLFRKPIPQSDKAEHLGAFPSTPNPSLKRPISPK